MESGQDEFMFHISRLYPHFTKKKQSWPGVGGGWIGLVEEFYREMNSQYQAAENKVEWIKKFDVLCIKEKFGCLEIYYAAKQTQEQFDRVHEILGKSITVCEICGRPGELRRDLSWLKTLCDKHHQKFQERENDR